MPTPTFDITGDIHFGSDRHELDFGFVSVRPDNDAGQTRDPFGCFTLIEESGKAVKGEPDSIIQHARGDRTIVGIKGDFIYYSTATEPGSSGAPVLDDQWLPVALHHRSVPHPVKLGVWIANRGIRISQPFRKLREAASAGDFDAGEVLRLMGADTGGAVPASSDCPLRPREGRFIPSPDTTLPADGSIGETESPFSADRWAKAQGYDPDFPSQAVPLPLPAGSENVRAVNGAPICPAGISRS